MSFIWDAWKWVFSGDGDCGTVTGGFGSFPTFSIQAYDWYGSTMQCLVIWLAPCAPSAPHHHTLSCPCLRRTWYFDFQINYVGVGMLWRGMLRRTHSPA